MLWGKTDLGFCLCSWVTLFSPSPNLSLCKMGIVRIKGHGIHETDRVWRLPSE